MSHGDVRELLEKAFDYYEEQGVRDKDPNLAVLDFKRFYGRDIPQDARPAADAILTEWVT